MHCVSFNLHKASPCPSTLTECNRLVCSKTRTLKSWEPSFGILRTWNIEGHWSAGSQDQRHLHQLLASRHRLNQAVKRKDFPVHKVVLQECYRGLEMIWLSFKMDMFYWNCIQSPSHFKNKNSILPGPPTKYQRACRTACINERQEEKDEEVHYCLCKKQLVSR